MAILTLGDTKADFTACVESLRADFRQQLTDRVCVMQADWQPLLQRYIRSIHYSPAFAQHVLRFATTAVNRGRMVSNQVANVYKLGVRRIVPDDSTQGALSSFYQEALVDAKAPWWNKLAFATGPVMLVPYVTPAGVGALDVVPSSRFEVVVEAGNPMDAMPVFAVWKSGDLYKAADDRFFYAFNPEGSLLGSVEHGAGVCPVVVVRSRVFQEDDPWDIAVTQPLLDGTLLLAYFFARLHMRRKQQDAFSVSVIGDTSSLPPGQALLSGEQPLVIDNAPGQTTTVESMDLNLSPDQHIRHIRTIVGSVVEQYGIPEQSVTFDYNVSERGSTMLSVSKEVLDSVRSDQMPFFHRVERELLVKVALVMRGMGHHMLSDVSINSVYQSRIEFPELNRINDPLQQTRVEEWELSHLIVDEVDLVQRRHPHLTREEAWNLLRKNLDTRAAIAQTLASRDLILDTSRGMLSTPQVFGAIGRETRNDANG